MRWTKAKLSRACLDLHKNITRCSHVEAKWWWSECWKAINGENAAIEVLGSLDHHPVCLAMIVLRRHGLEKEPSKQIVCRLFGNKSWNHFFRALRWMANSHGGKYSIGELHFSL